MTRRCARSTRSTRRRRLDRAPAARRHRAFARRGATIETRRRVGRTRARLSALARISDGWTPSTSRARVVGRPTASARERDDAASRPRETRARRAASARDARVARGKREKERERATGRRARTTRADAGPRPRRRATRIFFLCARRVTRPRRRAGTVARRERECEWCDFELMCSIAIVRRARRCASPPRARL